MKELSIVVPRLISMAICCALVTVLLGFGLGAVFGIAEDNLKQHLKDSAAKVFLTVYKNDESKKETVLKKSWDYVIRAHLHGGAIGTAALASMAILILLCRLDGVAQASALAFGLGGFLYALFWLMAGLAAPALGSTGAAKEFYSFLALPGSGLSLLGLCGTIYCVVRDQLIKPA